MCTVTALKRNRSGRRRRSRREGSAPAARPRPPRPGRRDAAARRGRTTRRPGRGGGAAPGWPTGAIEAGGVDTVLVAFPDLQGRPVGKRTTGRFFLERVTGPDGSGEGIGACAYLVATDHDNNPVPGYRFANYERGYGDMRAVADPATIRRIPWVERTALVLCDLVDVGTGAPVEVSPRRVLAAKRSEPLRWATRRCWARRSSSTCSWTPTRRPTARAIGASPRPPVSTRCDLLGDELVRVFLTVKRYELRPLRRPRDRLGARGVRRALLSVAQAPSAWRTSAA